MSIRISGVDIYYDELKKRLEDKNTLLLDLKNYLYFNRLDPKLTDYLIDQLQDEDQVVRVHSLISIYILLKDFSVATKLSAKEEELFKTLVKQAKVDTNYETITSYVNKELDE